MTPPQHVAILRWALVVVFVVVLVAAALLLPWSDVVTSLAPWVDGPRQGSVWA